MAKERWDLRLDLDQDVTRYEMSRSGKWKEECNRLPGLERRGKKGESKVSWRIRRKIQDYQFNFRTGIYEITAARIFYGQWELDPFGYQDYKNSTMQKARYSLRHTIKKYAEERLSKGSYVREKMVTELLMRFAAIVGPDEPMTRVQRSHLAEFIAQDCQGNAPSTIDCKVRQIQAWWRFSVARNYAKEDVFRGYKTPQIKPVHTWRSVFVSLENLMTTIKHINERNKTFGNCEAALLLVGWGTGARRGEVLALKETDLLVPEVGYPELRIQSLKKNKSHLVRRVPLTDDKIHAACQLWCSLSWAAKSRVMVRTSKDLVSIPREEGCLRFSFHALRHSRITQWALDGCSPYDIKRWAGHHSMDQTMDYIAEAQKAVVLPKKSGITDEQFMEAMNG